MKNYRLYEAEKRFEEAFFLADFHRWEARKGFYPCGKDPLTGREFKNTAYRSTWHKKAGIESNKAMAKVYLKEAQKIREYILTLKR